MKIALLASLRCFRDLVNQCTLTNFDLHEALQNKLSLHKTTEILGAICDCHTT